MPANVVIRPAGEADLPGVKAIYDEYVAHSIATFDVVPRPLDVWRRYADRMFVAVTDQVVGFAYHDEFRPKPAYSRTRETTVYLASGGAGQGTGRKLYAELLADLAATDAHTAVAVIALPNPASVALHASMGFTESGRLRQVGHKFGEYIDVAYFQKML